MLLDPVAESMARQDFDKLAAFALGRAPDGLGHATSFGPFHRLRVPLV